MITRILNQLVGARTLQYHTVAIKHEVSSILKLGGFVVPLGLAVGWCAWPAIGDEKKMELGLPTAEVPSAGAQFKYENEFGDTMPIPK